VGTTASLCMMVVGSWVVMIRRVLEDEGVSVPDVPGRPSV